MKNITCSTNDGTILFSVNTYQPSKPSFNLDRNVITIKSHVNPIQTPNPPSYPINNENSLLPLSSPYNSSDLYMNPNNINPESIKNTSTGYNDLKTILVKSSKTYTYPANTIDPPQTGGDALSYDVLENAMTKAEFQQANLQGWGWNSRFSGNLYPSYNVATIVDAEDTDDSSYNGYYFIIGMSYIKIN